MQQLDLIEQFFQANEKPVEKRELAGYNATLVQYDSSGEVIAKCGFNWPNPFKTKKEVKDWECSLKTRGKLGDQEFIEPRAVYKYREIKK